MNIKANKGIAIRVLCWVIFGIFIAGSLIFYYSAVHKWRNIEVESKKGVSIQDTFKLLFKPGETAFEGKDRLNILCLGLDYNHDEKGMIYSKNARSDTVFVISLNLKDQSVGVLSIPRDLWVDIGSLNDEYGADKINSAYSYGGVDLAKKTIESLLNIPIDRYVVLRILACKEIVDAIGGVDLNVEKDMDYDDNWGNLHVHLKKGNQRLNGDQCVGYCRFRYDEEGDRGRMRRQQQFMQALIKELKKPQNISKFEEISMIVKKNLETDLTILQLIDLARIYSDYEPEKMRKGRIDGTDDYYDGISCMIPDENQTRRMVKRIFEGDPKIFPDELVVEVLNGGDDIGRAYAVADALVRAGFIISDVKDAPTNDYLASQIIDYSGNPDTYLTLSQLIPMVKIVDGSILKSEHSEDLTFIVGKNIDLDEINKRVDDYMYQTQAPQAPVNENTPSNDNSNVDYNKFNDVEPDIIEQEVTEKIDNQDAVEDTYAPYTDNNSTDTPKETDNTNNNNSEDF